MAAPPKLGFGLDTLQPWGASQRDFPDGAYFQGNERSADSGSAQPYVARAAGSEQQENKPVDGDNDVHGKEDEFVLLRDTQTYVGDLADSDEDLSNYGVKVKGATEGEDGYIFPSAPPMDASAPETSLRLNATFGGDSSDGGGGFLLHPMPLQWTIVEPAVTPGSDTTAVTDFAAAREHVVWANEPVAAGSGDWRTRLTVLERDSLARRLRNIQLSHQSLLSALERACDVLYERRLVGPDGKGKLKDRYVELRNNAVTRFNKYSAKAETEIRNHFRARVDHSTITVICKAVNRVSNSLLLQVATVYKEIKDYGILVQGILDAGTPVGWVAILLQLNTWGGRALGLINSKSTCDATYNGLLQRVLAYGFDQFQEYITKSVGDRRFSSDIARSEWETRLYFQARDLQGRHEKFALEVDQLQMQARQLTHEALQIRGQIHMKQRLLYGTERQISTNPFIRTSAQSRPSDGVSFDGSAVTSDPEHLRDVDSAELLETLSLQQYPPMPTAGMDADPSGGSSSPDDMLADYVAIPDRNGAVPASAAGKPTDPNFIDIEEVERKLASVQQKIGAILLDIERRFRPLLEASENRIRELQNTYEDSLNYSIGLFDTSRDFGTRWSFAVDVLPASLAAASATKIVAAAM